MGGHKHAAVSISTIERKMWCSCGAVAKWVPFVKTKTVWRKA